MKKYIQITKILIIVLALTLGVSYASAAWTSAPASPPSNNTGAPLNVTSSFQSKAAGLSLTGWSFLQNSAGPQSAGGGDARPAIVWGTTDDPQAWFMGTTDKTNGQTLSTEDLGIWSWKLWNNRSGQGWQQKWRADGTQTLYGKVGISTDVPTANLDVTGDLRLRIGTTRSPANNPSPGNVLIATDAQGNARWGVPPTPTVNTTVTVGACTVEGPWSRGENSNPAGWSGNWQTGSNTGTQTVCPANRPIMCGLDRADDSGWEYTRVMCAPLVVTN